MLNDITKRKINSLRDILVGVVPSPEAQVGQITNALIYKYMDDMDRQAESFGGKASFFAGEYKKYSWRNLMDPKLGGQERMNLYVEALEQMAMNKNLPSIFRDILKEAYLPYRSPETLNLFLHEIDGFSYDHSEELGNAFEYLLSIMGAQGDAGQFRTPRHIIDFIVKVVEPKKGEKILDPACGTAGFLISAYNYILENNKKNRPGDKLSNEELKNLHHNFTGYDINPDMTKFSRVNMFLHNFPDPKIYDYDTLSSLERWDENFDVILANPPFMTPKGGIIPHKRFSVQAKKSEVLFVDYIMQHLRPNGRAGIIVPEGIIFKSENAYKTLRKLLIEDGLFAVVSLPSGVFNPYAGVKTSILFFDNALAKKTDKILFIKIDNDGYGLGAQRREHDKNDLPKALEIINLWKENIGVENFKIDDKITHLVSKDKIAESGDYNLSGERYRENVKIQNSEFEMVELWEVCEFIGGYAFKSTDLIDEEKEEFVPVIKIGNLDKGGLINFNKVQYCKYKRELDSYFINEGDILIAMTGATVGKVAVSNDNEPKYLNQRVGIIATKSEKLSQDFLKRLLVSDKFYNYCQLVAGGGAQGNISPRQILKFKIPLPPIEVQREIVEEIEKYQKIIDGAKQIIENWKPKIEIDPEWESVKLGEVLNIVKEQVDPQKKIGEVFYISLENIDSNSGKIVGELSTKYEEIKSTKNVFRSGDLLYGKLRPNLNKVWLADRAGICSTDILVFRCKENSSTNFYWYVLLDEDFVSEAMAGIKGAQLPRVGFEYLKNLILPLPPLEIQNQIVEKIEAERELVEGNKKLIKIYEQKIKEVLNRIYE
ncbi:MAG: N-6 DNA methylase [bacterium]